ncbi:MAG TPA: sulfatase [Pelobium sp.]|nr:sulfatase [Pelobium sp.]
MKKHKAQLSLTVVLVIILGFLLAFKKQDEKPVKPNIIFLLADDLRYNSLGCMGNTIVQTPNLDQMAYNGTLFTNAYVTTPICAISRASIFSGQYANKHGINDFIKDFDTTARANNYPNVLRNNGYYTGFIGKYGVSLKQQPTEFDYWKGFHSQGKYFYEDKNGKQIHNTDLLANQALEFLAIRDKSKPFCLSVSFKAPHVEDGNNTHNGYLYSPAYENYYKDITIPYPSNSEDKYYQAFPDVFKNRPADGATNEARVRWGLRFSTPEKYQESVKSYYRLVTGMDDAIKRIVDQLKKKGLEKNTVIIFSSDNGYSLGDHGLEGKWFGHDVSLRSVIIVYDGRKPQNKHTNRDMVLNVDIAPTILDYADIKAPETMQGKSFKPLVEGEKLDWRKDFYYNHLLDTRNSKVYLPMSEGVVTATYKYNRYFHGNNPDDFFYEELFNPKTDPLEIHNLANDAEKAKIKTELIARMKTLRKSSK